MFRSTEGRGKKDLLFSLSIVGILLLSVSCEHSLIEPDGDPIPDRVLILAPNDVVVTGDTARFTAIVFDRNGKEIADAPITWSTTKPKVASIDATGLLTGRARGNVSVLATVSGIPVSADVYGDVSAAPPPGKGNQGGNGSKPIKVRDAGSLVIQPVDVNLTALEETTQLEAGLVGSSGTDSSLDVKWRALDRKVATVDDDGMARAVRAGVARVVASTHCCGADTAVVHVDPRVASIEILNHPDWLEPGTTVELEARTKDKNGHEISNPELTWATSDSRVASIDQDGNLTANNTGKADITASADDAATTVSMEVVGTDPAGSGNVTLSITPSSYTFTTIGAEARVRVIGITEGGDTIFDPTVKWSSSDRKVVEVDALGRIFSRGAGSALITASCTLCVAATMSASVSIAGAPSGDRPNEPGGFTRWAEHDFSCVPGSSDCSLTHGRAGQDSGMDNYSVVQDPSAPGGKAVRIRYREGLGDGRSPGRFWIHDGDQTPLKEWYVSLWVQFEGPDWEFAPNEVKLWYNGVGQLGKASKGGGVRLRSGSGSPVIRTTSRPRMSARPCYECTIRQLSSSEETFRVGEWVHLEHYGRVSTPGKEDGVYRMYVNGTLVSEFTDVQNQHPDDWTDGLFEFHWAPVWGGKCSDGCPKTRDDFMRLGHLYVSGIAQ